MQKILTFHRTVATVCGLLVMALMFIIVIDSGGRFLLNKPLQGAVEISVIVLGWILFGSLAYALVQGTHIRVTLFVERLPNKLRFATETGSLLISITFFSFAVYAGWGQFWESFLLKETMNAPIWIPFWLGKLAVPVGSFMIAAQLGIDLITHFRSLRKKE